MTKNSTLAKRLAGYSAMAVAGVATIGTANGQIVYNDFADVTLNITDTVFSLDVNSDGTEDYFIGYSDRTAANNGDFLYIYNSAGNQVMITGVTTWQPAFYYMDALALNAPINSAGNWLPMDGSHIGVFATSYMTSVYGNFYGGADQYMGMVFGVGGSFYYGWLRVQVTLDPANVSVNKLVLLDCAYNSVADQPILAGQTTVGIAEEGLNASVFAADKKLNINTEVAGTLSVFNTVGQNVVSQQITENTVIDMSGYSAGIYTVQFESNGKMMTKKVSL
ncbi:MAG: hypothetical protein A2W93_14775 [Bacteroidetes bacterium GWF2_43_63]|nr:MAG: hypothetical protein A2W94_01345 [Bacteroidetes bacterium GWE2_42_42]OFY52603.1 MAG: hypothetical protein A2W93_14775 [Bacteroidetes bacterium GWF2_43_63]HBG69874.1 hypothetical protein [Bacteroidales bacterium]HCB62699.1 hypothetical protein [Bacteroidales bacterium]HCY23539.1 hypothetical protein [Bacteroidales bacterium]